MTPIQKYLDPISPDKPCGDNLCYDQAFLDLQVKIRGKEETQFAAAEDPNWKEILDLSLSLTERFKHLQVGVILTLALLQVEGLLGFRDGLKLLRGWIDQFWTSLYPLLDPDDNNDPTERVNILQCLSMTSMGDAYRFCDRLNHALLCESKTLGQFSFHKITHGGGNGEGAADAAQVAAAFRDSSSDKLQESYNALIESVGLLDELDNLLMKRVGAGRGPNWEGLRKKLAEIRSCMSPYVPKPASGAADDDLKPQSSGSVQAQNSAGPGTPGVIKSREDVMAALQAVCAYYQMREPSSPVPLLLQRAQRMVTMDFLQIMNELAPEALVQMKVITGTPEVKS